MVDASPGTALIERAPPAAAIVAQATSDDGMVELWLRKHRNSNTKSAYAADLRAFRAFCPQPLRQVTVKDITDFADSLTDLADVSQSRRLSAVKSLIAYACQLGYLALDVGAPMQLPKIKNTLSERILDEGLVMRMLDMEKHPRNAALLSLIYAAGLRVSEACALRWKDMKERPSSGQATFFGKGGKTRVILLPPGLWGQLAALRGDAGPEDFVFRSRKGGGGILRMQVHIIIKKAAKRAKLPPGVSAHWLRHAHVSHALKRNTPVHIVQATVGHSSLTTTTRYAHAMPDDSSALHLAVR